MIAAICAVAFMVQPPTAAELTAWGEECLAHIRSHYAMPGRHLFADSVEPGKPHTQVAFNWGVGVMMSALNAATVVDHRHAPALKEFAQASHAYWNDAPPVAGFDVLPPPKPIDRFYDDNAWMVMALHDAGDLLKEPRFKGWAADALKYVFSGEDAKLGGGIYWKETEKTSKNTCSNGPAAAAWLVVSPKDTAKPRAIYDWTKRTLQDPSDSLYWDAIRMDGTIDRAKWSYNTALMIRTARGLGLTSDAERMVTASVARWLPGDGATGVNDEARFGHLLLENIDSGSNIDRVGRALRYVHDHCRNAAGFYGKRWDAAPPADQKAFELIDQASVARAFFQAAWVRSKR